MNSSEEDSCFEKLVAEIREGADRSKEDKKYQKQIKTAWTTLKIKFCDHQPVFEQSVFSLRSRNTIQLTKLVGELIDFDKVHKACGLSQKHADDQLFRLRRFNNSDSLQDRVDRVFIDLIDGMLSHDEAEIVAQLEKLARLNDLFFEGASEIDFRASVKLIAQVYPIPKDVRTRTHNTTPESILELNPPDSEAAQILLAMFESNTFDAVTKKTQEEILSMFCDPYDARRAFNRLEQSGAIRKVGKNGCYLLPAGKKAAEILADAKARKTD